MGKYKQMFVQGGRSAGKTAIVELTESIAQDQSDVRIALIALRAKQGISTAEMLIRTGMTVSELDAFETYWANPTGDEILRYAVAVGAYIKTEVSGGW